jgi:hypothetical protein
VFITDNKEVKMEKLAITIIFILDILMYVFLRTRLCEFILGIGIIILLIILLKRR